MRSRWGLATRLTVAVVLVLVPLLVYTVGAYAQELDERKAEEIAHAQTLAQNVAAVVDAFTRDIEGTVFATAISVGSQARPVDQDTNGPQLAALLREYPILRSIFLTDLDGRVTASGTGTGVGTDLSTRPYMVALRGGAETVWSGSLSGIESGEITVAYGRVARDGGAAPRAFVLAAFHPQVVVAGLRPVLPEDSRTLIVDEMGILLFDSARAAVRADERDLSGVPEIERALKGTLAPVARGVTAPFEGTERYGAAVRVERTGWVLLYSRPLAPLEAGLQERLLYRAALMALLIALAAMFTLVVARRLVQPLSEMARAADAISRGERPAIEVRTGDPEVAKLGDAMRHMSMSITRREEELRFLAEASDILGSSLDLRETLRSIARLAVPRLADWCIVDLLDGEEVSRIEVVHADPGHAHFAEQLEQQYRPDLDDPRSVVGTVMRTGTPRLFEDVSDELLQRISRDQQLLELYRGIGLRSGMVVPMAVRGRVVGAISMMSTASGRNFGAQDLALAMELARRAAVALDNSNLYAQVQQAVRTRDEFLSAAAHEMKTPLASIKGMAQVLRRQAQRGDLGRLDERLERIDAAASKLARYIDELLDLTRLRLENALDLELAPVDLVELAERRCREQALLSERHRIAFDAAAAELVGMWDRARVERVIDNLLSNAVKFSPDGGEVRVRVERGPGEALLRVEDGGIGIPPEDLERIWERFGRASNAVGRISGTGVGLSLVKQIVEQHGGRVEVASQPGRTVFTVRLPLGEAPAEDVAG